MKGSFGGRPEPFPVQRHPKLRRLFAGNGLESVASEACGKVRVCALLSKEEMDERGAIGNGETCSCALATHVMSMTNDLLSLQPTTRHSSNHDAKRFDSLAVEGLPEEPMYATPDSPFVSAGAFLVDESLSWLAKLRRFTRAS